MNSANRRDRVAAEQAEGYFNASSCLPLGFPAGTKLATVKGERPVEALRAGFVLNTLHGGQRKIEWIGQRSFDAAAVAGDPGLQLVRIAADALEDGVPARPLRVAPHHGICIDGVLIPAIRLANNVSIRPESAAEPAGYYHVETAGHEVIFAEGCPLETCHGAPAPAPCLPWIEDGFVLQAIQHRLNQRAGIAPVAVIHGGLRGFVDTAGPSMVSGWAQCEAQPEEPVCLDVYVDGQRIMRVLANRYRDDLREAGLGSGNHSFSVRLPEDVSGAVEVRRTFDLALLPLTDGALAALAGR
jgi:hypothetical protein